jgi:hypothetical protein
MLLDVLIQSAPALICALSVASVLTLAYSRIQRNLKIKRLGGRAAVMKSNFLGMSSLNREGLVLVLI